MLGRPNLTPGACARFLPSPVRARISSRSNSARPPSTVSISRPCGVVVSAQVFSTERKPAPDLAKASRTFNRSRVDLARRSRRETMITSPESSARSSLARFRPIRFRAAHLFSVDFRAAGRLKLGNLSALATQSLLMRRHQGHGLRGLPPARARALRDQFIRSGEERGRDGEAEGA